MYRQSPILSISCQRIVGCELTWNSESIDGFQNYMRIQTIKTQTALLLFFTWFQNIKWFVLKKCGERNWMFLIFIKTFMQSSYWIQVNPFCGNNHFYFRSFFACFLLFPKIVIGYFFKISKEAHLRSAFRAIGRIVGHNGVLNPKVIHFLLWDGIALPITSGFRWYQIFQSVQLIVNCLWQPLQKMLVI